MALLEVDDLHVHFRTDRGTVRAVNGVSFRVDKGETLGIVGESGSGKSVTSLAVMGLLPSPPARVPKGSVRFADKELLKLPARQLRALRGDRIAMIFQDPMSSLNPFLRVSTQLVEVLRLHEKLDKASALDRSVAMLTRVGIPAARRRLHSYPHEFSGGMRQRVMIAMSLLCEPELLIADEPTTALDVTIQAQILELLDSLKRDFGMGIILITHDLGVVAGHSDRIVVMYGGQIMEQAPTAELFANPLHPYTRGLLRSVPRLDEERVETLYSIPGMPPTIVDEPRGCPFADRCEHAMDRCRSEAPPDRAKAPDHQAFCWLEEEQA